MAPWAVLQDKRPGWAPGERGAGRRRHDTTAWPHYPTVNFWEAALHLVVASWTAVSVGLKVPLLQPTAQRIRALAVEAEEEAHCGRLSMVVSQGHTLGLPAWPPSVCCPCASLRRPTTPARPRSRRCTHGHNSAKEFPVVAAVKTRDPHLLRRPTLGGMIPCLSGFNRHRIIRCRAPWAAPPLPKARQAPPARSISHPSRAHMAAPMDLSAVVSRGRR